MKLRLIELFAGYGSQALALKYENIPFQHWFVCDFDKYAIQAYNQLHGTNFPTTDIRNVTAKDLNIVDTNQFTYLLTYSFPCQDLSKAGKGKGMSKDDNTRSGLLWEVERLLNECKELPQYLLMENVPDVIGSKNIKDFAKWIEFLDRLGYKSYYQLLNAKDYGIPQNRNRCFMVSILDKSRIYEFPKPIPLKLKLKDMLEDNVDEKYYLSEKALNGVLNTKFQSSKLESRIEKDGIIPTLCARDYKDPKLVMVGTLQGGHREPDDNPIKVNVKEYANYITWEDKKGRLNTQDHRAFLPEKICGTVPAMERGIPKILVEDIPNPFTVEDYLSGKYDDYINRIGMLIEDCDDYEEWHRNQYIPIPEATKKGYAEAHEGDGVYLDRPHQKRGVVQKGMIQTIKTSGSDVGVVVRDTRNLKEKLCDELIQSGIVKGGEIINHSYTNEKKNPNSRLTLEDYIETKDGIMPTLTTRPDTLGVVVVGEHRRDEGLRTFKDDVIGTLRTNEACGDKVVVTNPPLRIRKLTPKECWRLMGVKDDDFDKLHDISNSQLYKLAGNSIVTNVLQAIFRKMFIDTTVENYQMSLFDLIETEEEMVE